MHQHHGITMCCSVLQCAAGCCSVLQGVAGCWCDRIQVSHDVLAPWYCSVLQCVAEGVADCGRVLQCVAVWCRCESFRASSLSLSLSLSLQQLVSEISRQQLQQQLQHFLSWLREGLPSLSLSHSPTLPLVSEILRYGVATMSRLLKITGLFCKRAL